MSYSVESGTIIKFAGKTENSEHIVWKSGIEDFKTACVKAQNLSLDLAGTQMNVISNSYVRMASYLHGNPIGI